MTLIKIPQDAKIPLIGLLNIGILDRGSNLLEVRASTSCNLNCTFCATNHEIRKTHFLVDPKYMIQWIREAIKLKGNKITEIHLDSVGETLSNPGIIEIIKGIKKINKTFTISIQTNGLLLNEDKIRELEKAGLTRLNISLHSLDPKKAKTLAGKASYSLEKVLENIHLVSKSQIELLIAPVWCPNVNDEDMEEIIKLCKELKCQSGIQKYEEYKYSKKQPEVKKINWYKFYNHLKIWEKKYDSNLTLSPRTFKIKKTKKIPLAFEKKDKLQAVIVSPGWMEDQKIAVVKNRAITITNCTKKIGDRVNIRITENKNSIYLAKEI